MLPFRAFANKQSFGGNVTAVLGPTAALARKATVCTVDSHYPRRQLNGPEGRQSSRTAVSRSGCHNLSAASPPTMVRGGTPGDVRGLKRKAREDDEDDEDIAVSKRGSVSHRANGTAHVERPLNPYVNFRKGNLVRLHMKSFITFSDTFMEPSPRLNLVSCSEDVFAPRRYRGCSAWSWRVY